MRKRSLKFFKIDRYLISCQRKETAFGLVVIYEKKGNLCTEQISQAGKLSTKPWLTVFNLRCMKKKTIIYMSIIFFPVTQRWASQTSDPLEKLTTANMFISLSMNALNFLLATFPYTPGFSFCAQPSPEETIPICFPDFLIYKAPPLSPPQESFPPSETPAQIIRGVTWYEPL